MDLKGKESEDATGTTTDNIIKDLPVRCVSNTSKKNYESSNVTNIRCTIPRFKQWILSVMELEMKLKRTGVLKE